MTVGCSLADLHRAVDATALLVDGIREDNWSAPTPCTEWSVREVVAHLVVGHRVFASLLTATEPPPRTLPDLAHDERSRAYRTTADEMLAAFGAPDALERPVALPIGEVPGSVALGLRVVEALAHGWDLARATGQPTSVDEVVAERAEAFTAATLPAVPTGDRFGSPQPVADDAGSLERLVALVGRDPGWSPAVRG